MNDLEKLSSKAHIKIKNNFTGFLNTPETTIWHLEAEHCAHRGCYIKCESKDLEDLIKTALKRMIEIEQRYNKKVEAFQMLYPEKDEYDIHEMVRQSE